MEKIVKKMHHEIKKEYNSDEKLVEFVWEPKLFAR